MSSLVPARADWAVWGKHPGTRDDYSVLASSTGLLSQGEFYQLLRHFTPGNPTADAGAPGSLPWVMLTRVGIADQLYLGISVQEPTADRDGAGRPISRTRYFCFPYGGLGDTPVSYQGLYQSVTGQELPPAGSDPIQLAIPRLDPASLARTVLELGAETVAATAAMLLAGPVTVTGPSLPDPRTRLRFLDAVAALLPYGYRAYLTGATWSDSPAGDRFRIVFASRARDEASRVTLDSPLRPPAGGAAQAYFALLARVIGEEGELETLIDYLTGLAEPRKFEEPVHAVGSLREFFLVPLVAEDIAGAPAADVRRVFSTGQVRRLGRPARAPLLLRLVSFGDPGDVPLVSLWFDDIAGETPEVLLDGIAGACRGGLWSAGSAALAEAYLPLTREHGLADDLLARLVLPAPPPADPMPGLDAVGKLLAAVILADPGQVTPAYPKTQRALAGNPAAGAALLARVAVTGQPGARDIESAVGWLEPAVDEVVRPFVSLLGDLIGGSPEPVDAGMLEQLNRSAHRESVRYLLRAASQLRRPRLVLRGLATWLAAARPEGGPMTEADSRYWDDAAREVTPADDADAIWLDLALLATGNAPRALSSGARLDRQPQYSRGLADAWRELCLEVRSRGGNDRAVDELLETALISALEQLPWRGDKDLAAAVLDLVRSLGAARPRPRLQSVVLSPREALLQMPRDASPADIAQACARAHRERVPFAEATGALASSGAIATAEKALEVIEALRLALAGVTARDDPPGGPARLLWPAQLAACFARGDFGERIAAEFPALAGVCYASQIAFGVTLLNFTGQYAAPDGPPMIGDQLAGHLDNCGKNIEELVRNARKRQQGGLRGRLPWGRGGQETEASQVTGSPAQGQPGDQAGPAPLGGQPGTDNPAGHGSQGAQG